MQYCILLHNFTQHYLVTLETLITRNERALESTLRSWRSCTKVQ